MSPCCVLTPWAVLASKGVSTLMSAPGCHIKLPDAPLPVRCRRRCCCRRCPRSRSWLYPDGSLRDYQFKAAWRLIGSNSLVCLPTGTGKTLIAAVVMFNYYRWFPKVGRT